MLTPSRREQSGMAFIPIERLRLTRLLAPASAYDVPDPGALAHSIVEGKRELDRITQNELSGVSDASRDASPATSAADGHFNISQRAPLPLPGTLSHRAVDGVHLWIGVEEGVAIVLDHEEHALFLRLRDGVTPAELVDGLPQPRSRTARWSRVTDLIGRLAVGGFIRGVGGYTDQWKPTPRRFMRLHLTQRCNLTCIHCYADSSPHVHADGELPVERWLGIIDDFADAGGERVLFTGGEALVFPGCADLLQRAHARGLDVTLFSNGILIDRYLGVIRECVDQVQISIDGPDAETNDPIRGPGSFRRAKSAVDTLLAAGVRVRISMVVMEQNLEAMRTGFLPFARQWPRGQVEFRLGYGVAHHGRGAELGDTLEIHDVRPIVDRLLEELEGDGGPRLARSTKGCGYAEQVVIAPDGTVHPCHLLDGALTHIDDQSMPALIGLLEQTALDYDIDHTVGCNRCDIRNLCGGSCRVQNGKVTGNRRVTNCTAFDKLHRLQNLVQTFSESVRAQAPAPDWE
jgi:radical SAM protein with 4Fe4S-binding SPASM domain